MSPLIVIAGPTASGKSDLAISLAKKYQGVVINGDSRQIYADFNIISAKPTPDSILDDGTWVIDGVRHYLFGFKTVDQEYSIYDYQKDVEAIRLKVKAPIFMTGGSGLYIDSVIHGYKLQENKNNNQDLDIESIKKELGEEINKLNESDSKNPRRLFSLYKRGISREKTILNNYLYLVINIPKEELERRIEARTESMFNNGIVNEAKVIYEKYKDSNFSSLDTIGYKEFIKYFEEEQSIEATKSLILVHTRQYAKRQKTWFKRNPEIKYIKNEHEADYEVRTFLNTL